MKEDSAIKQKNMKFLLKYLKHLKYRNNIDACQCRNVT